MQKAKYENSCTHVICNIMNKLLLITISTVHYLEGKVKLNIFLILQVSGVINSM